MRVRSLLVVASLVSLAGCSATGRSSNGDDSAHQAEAVTYGGAVGDWSAFPSNEQCLVGVQLFYPSLGVYVPAARNSTTGDCAPQGACHIWLDDIPNADVWERIPNDGSKQPSLYDMIVYPPVTYSNGHVNPYGHVASVDHVDTDGNIFVMDDNWNGDELKAPSPHTTTPVYVAYGWYHLRSRPKDGGGGATSGGGPANDCPNDGLYCGGDYIGGDPATLYRCSAHQLAVVTVCDNGCIAEPAGVDDQCASAPTPTPAWCPNDGLYCGGDYIAGDPGTLYRCSGHQVSIEATCGGGCVVQPDGYDDHCN